MAKLYFRYGAMGASKTANALMVQYNYEERGKRALLFKPAIDNRDGEHIVKSRIGIFNEAHLVNDETDLFYDVDRLLRHENVDCVIVDESQFLSKAQVEQLTRIVDQLDVPVIAYGLRTDFQGELFEGSSYLLAWADSIEEIKTVCYCGRKATMNARLSNGKVVKNGDQIQIGGNESYIALCRDHWRSGSTE